MAKQLPSRPAKKPTSNTNSSNSVKKVGGMAGQNGFDFPVLFTIDGSNRHEVILVNPGLDLEQLKETVQGVLESPNCAEILSNYRNKENKDEVGDIRVKWSSEGRDKQLFPKDTLLTDDNVEPVLRLMSASGIGKDTFDIKLKQPQKQQQQSQEQQKPATGGASKRPPSSGPPKKPSTPSSK
ncbi:hypothetical protein PRZ48_006545 [Zasmidium cellare]|uniref:Uncharacterized protein n=1 Tax=Zasmidium cellare TaxID=395010 RepID=A0ABR0EPL7_ZASCE|nr:hypothetical protein PRZ48_006545 [Zasmidium cellare]